MKSTIVVILLLCGVLSGEVRGQSSAPPPPGPPPGMPPSPPIGPVSVEVNVNRPGQDYASFAVPQADVGLCQSACERDARCTAYTYVHAGQPGSVAQCWLKSSAPPPVSDACCISGMR